MSRQHDKQDLGGPNEFGWSVIGIFESRASLVRRIERMSSESERSARLGVGGFVAVGLLAFALLPMAGGPAASSADPKEAVPQAGKEKKGAAPTAVGEAGRKEELRGRRKRAAIDAAGQFDGKANFSGFVLDESEKPVTDARIEIQPADGGLHQSVKADEKGYFQFQQVRAGTYWLSIISKRCIGINNRGRLPELNLGAGSDTIRDFHLKISRQARVTVVDEKQQPLEGVQFYRKGDDFDLEFVGKSDAEGIALLEGLQSSETDVTFAAIKKDFAIGRLSLRLKDPKGVPEAKLTLSEGISISGTAICSDGKPAKGMRLNVAPSWLRTALYGGQQTVGEDGSFTFHNISRDPQHVTVYIQTGESFETKTLLTDADLFNHRGPLKLKINYPSPDSLGYIEGRIEYTKGKPTKGFFLYAEHEDRKNRSNASHYIKPNQETFRLGPFPAGRYQLSDGASEFVPRELPIITAPAKAVRLTFEYRGKRIVHGKVMRGDDGTPFNDFRVRLLGVSTPPFRRRFHGLYMRWLDVNHPRGEFSLELLDPGTFKVEAVAEGYVNVVSSEISTEAMPKEVVIKLNRGRTVTGSVVDEEGTPIDGASVFLVDHRPEAWGIRKDNVPAGTKTSAGKFTLQGLGPGTRSLGVLHPDYVRAMGVVREDTPGKPAGPLQIVLTRGGTLRGRVYDDQGRPARGIELYFYDEDQLAGWAWSGPIATATSNDAGDYEASKLPPGTIRIARTGDEFMRGPLSLIVQAANGETRTVDFGGITAVRGRLLIKGTPFANGRLRVTGKDSHREGAAVSEFMTDAHGNFVLYGITPGEHFLKYDVPSSKSRDDWLRITGIRVPVPGNDLGVIDHDPDRADPTRRPHRTKPILSGSASIHGKIDWKDRGPPWFRHWRIRHRTGSIDEVLNMQPGEAFKLPGLFAGEYTLDFGFAGASRTALTFSLKEGESKEIVLTPEQVKQAMRPFEELKVRPILANGVRVPGCTVTLSDGKKELAKHAEQYAEHAFSIEPGKYTLTVSAPGFQHVIRTVEIKDSAPEGYLEHENKVEVVLLPEK